MKVIQKIQLFPLFFIFLFFHSLGISSPKIYDCFTFYNELEVLEIKLNELYDHVDYFVLVESTETFRGTPKPLYFEENKERFSRFLDKIIHVVVTEHLETDNPWDREFYQRDQISRGLTQCHDDDIIIVEDLDEILRASKLPEIIEPLLTNRGRFVSCSLPNYTYFLNRYGAFGGGTKIYYLCSVVAKYSDVRLLSPQGVRNQRTWDGAIQDAGWHFSYMGGVERVRRKFESFSHADFDLEEYKHADAIRKDANTLKLVEIDETFPQFVRDNIPYFETVGFIDSAP